MNSREQINQIVAKDIKAIARQAGFKKSGFNFYRHHELVVQIVNIQLSHSNLRNVGRFYVNVGLAFDELRPLDGQPVNEKLKEYECDYRRRLENLIENAPPHWDVTRDTDLDMLGRELAKPIRKLIEQMDRITCIASFLEQNWLGEGRDYGLQAKMHYVLGELDEAFRYIQKEAEFFAGREGMTVENLIRRYNLLAL